MKKIIKTEIEGLKLVLSEEEQARYELLVAIYGTAYVEITKGEARVLEPHVVAIMQHNDEKEDELVMGVDWGSDRDWSPDPDPKADLTKVVRNSLPIFRRVLLDGFDPSGKVWNEEERQEILDAPLPDQEYLCSPNTLIVTEKTAEFMRKYF